MPDYKMEWLVCAPWTVDCQFTMNVLKHINGEPQKSANACIHFFERPYPSCPMAFSYPFVILQMPGHPAFLSHLFSFFRVALFVFSRVLYKWDHTIYILTFGFFPSAWSFRDLSMLCVAIVHLLLLSGIQSYHIFQFTWSQIYNTNYSC